MRVLVTTHLTRTFGWKALAGALVLAITLVAGGIAPALTTAQSDAENIGGYLGYDTPQFYAGDRVTVRTDDGGGLKVRSKPSLDAEKVATLGDGDVVTIVDGPYYDGASNGWYLISDGSFQAYAFGGFLTAGGSSASSASNSSGSSSASSTGYLGYDTPQFFDGDRVVVRTDDGGGLRLRSGPSTGSEKVATLGDGDIVTIVDGPVYDGSSNGWYLVSDGSFQAYAFAGFLAPSGSSSAASSTSSSSGSTSSSGYLGYDTPQFYEGDRVTVRTDDGGGLRVRSGPSTGSAKVATLGEGDVVTIVDGPVYDGASNGWYLISDGSFQAYAFAGFLSASGSSTASSSSSSPSSSSSSSGYLGYDTPQFFDGDRVAVRTDDGGGLTVRSGPSTGSAKVATLGDGDVVTIVDGPRYDGSSNGWYLITDGSFEAYAFAGFLTAASSTTSTPAAASPSTSSSSSSSASTTTSSSTGGFIYPLASYTFTQGYGCSKYDFYAYSAAAGCRVHNGIDLAAPSYTPIRASAGGTVLEAGWCDCGLGYYVKISHGGGLETIYGHMAEMPYVTPGQVVSQGETIGPIGSTGLSTGPHVHFMVRLNGVAVNPLDYL